MPNPKNDTIQSSFSNISFSVFEPKNWSLSSAWLEHLAFNFPLKNGRHQGVAGSNPVGTTIFSNYLKPLTLGD